MHARFAPLLMTLCAADLLARCAIATETQSALFVSTKATTTRQSPNLIATKALRLPRDALLVITS